MSDTNSYKRVLITGANGLVGSAVVPILNKNYALKGTDIRPADDASIPFEVADIRKPEDVRRIVEGVDAVVHLAIAPYRSYKNANDDFDYHRSCLDINIGGTYTLFTEACEAGVRRFVYISSLTALMGHEGATHLSDEMLVNPLNVYGCSKVFGENLAQVYSRHYGAHFTCLRLGAPFPNPQTSKEQYLAHYGEGALPSHFTTMQDIAQGIDCALRYTGEAFSVFSLVSDNQNDYIDSSAYAQLSYQPGPVPLIAEWINE